MKQLKHLSNKKNIEITTYELFRIIEILNETRFEISQTCEDYYGNGNVSSSFLLGIRTEEQMLKVRQHEDPNYELIVLSQQYFLKGLEKLEKKLREKTSTLEDKVKFELSYLEIKVIQKLISTEMSQEIFVDEFEIIKY